MLYRLCNNGRGVLITREPIMLEGSLKVELETPLEEEYTAIIKSGGKEYYRAIREGVFELDARRILPGVMQIKVIKNGAVNPTWTLDELYAVCKGDCVAVAGNTLEYDRLLAEQRAEMDELREEMRAFKDELQQFRRDFDEVYADADILN